MAAASGEQGAGPGRGVVRDRRRELGAFLRYPATAADAAKLERLSGEPRSQVSGRAVGGMGAGSAEEPIR